MPLSAISVSRTQLRTVAAATLRAAGTDAGTRVYDPDNLPTPVLQLPDVHVAAPSERKDTAGTGAPKFNSVIALALLVRVEDDNEAAAENKLDALVGQVEGALLSASAMTDIVTRFEYVETHATITTGGERYVGEATIIMGCSVWQEFWPAPSPMLTEIVTTVPASGAGAPLTFDTVLPQ